MRSAKSATVGPPAPAISFRDDIRPGLRNIKIDKPFAEPANGISRILAGYREYYDGAT